MPKLHVVDADTTLAELTPTLLLARTSGAARKEAVAALRRANPGLDLDRLTSGTVLVVPEVEGLRSSVREADPVSRSADELFDRISEGVKSLVAASEAGEQTEHQESKETRALVSSPVVERMASQSDELAANVESLNATLEADAEEARRRLGELREAAEAWTTGLTALRGLLS